MRRRQVFAQMVAGADPMADRVYPVAAAVLQTEVLPSSIMMLSEAGGGEAPLSVHSPAPPAAQAGGAPCPKCGKALGVRGRHFHIRSCQTAEEQKSYDPIKRADEIMMKLSHTKR